MRTRPCFPRCSLACRTSSGAASSPPFQFRPTSPPFGQDALCRLLWPYHVGRLLSCLRFLIRTSQSFLLVINLIRKSYSIVDILQSRLLDTKSEIRGEWRNRTGGARLLSKGCFAMAEHMVRRNLQCLLHSICAHPAQAREMRLRVCSASSTLRRNGLRSSRSVRGTSAIYPTSNGCIVIFQY